MAMNRAQRRRIEHAEIDLRDIDQARRYLKGIFLGYSADDKNKKPLFPIEMGDGRIVDGETATDADIKEILIQMGALKLDLEVLQ